MQEKLLPHPVRVTVRKALKALESADKRCKAGETTDPQTIRAIVKRAGFRNRHMLESFARRHNLL